jgi:hypothetical protein
MLTSERLTAMFLRTGSSELVRAGTATSWELGAMGKELSICINTYS